jgi:hypothetical protein
MTLRFAVDRVLPRTFRRPIIEASYFCLKQLREFPGVHLTIERLVETRLDKSLHGVGRLSERSYHGNELPSRQYRDE